MTDEKIAEAVRVHGGQQSAAQALGISRGRVQRALRRLDAAGVTGGEIFLRELEKASNGGFTHRLVDSGVVLVGSDGHYWPDVPAPAHDQFVMRVAAMASGGLLQGVVYNGDAFDGARISRHARIGWENNPQVKDELACTQKRMGEIADCAGGVWKDWPLGNHDARFETFLSGKVPEYEGVAGVHLKDHFPLWVPCWGVRINSSVVVKHRLKGGVHARWSNVQSSGVTLVTAHTHRLGVTPLTDYSGTRWGVETGMLGNASGPQFRAYTEAGPVNWQMGWVELWFRQGQLLWPKAVHVEG